MSLEKKERNRLVEALYNQGKTNKEILEELLKAGFEGYQKVQGVKMLLSRLRKLGKIPQERPGGVRKIKRKQQVHKGISPQMNKVIKPQVDKSTNPPIHQRATYYLTREIIREVKLTALEKDIDSSELVRKILGKYLKKK